MKNLFLVLSVLMASTSGFADMGKVVVSCAKTSFNDLLKIEIIETDLKGQYQIVETSGEKRAPTVMSSVFGVEELKNNQLPELSPWGDYSRKLLREVYPSGKAYYTIEYSDVCGGGMIAIDCIEKF